jgi:GNAT superfamily N-acetyltransferase
MGWEGGSVESVDDRGARAAPADVSTVAIRRAVEADAAAVAALHVRAWQWAYRGLLPDVYLDGLREQVPQRENMWRRQLQGVPPDRPVWVAERGGEVIGFCNTSPARDDEEATAEVQALYLAPEVVGTGVGAALMRRALADLRERGYQAVVLWVLDTNSRARRFYEKGGWQADGAEKTETIWEVPVREVRYRIVLDDAGPP